ncbi:hypothetical protein BJG92_02032 [Arthrobacter sp. SO5]|nr:hypothetical protein [Arthrobacter sp. SO5]
MTKLATAMAMHTVETVWNVVIMGDSRVPLAMATARPAAIPAALEAQPSRASLLHRGRNRGHISLMVI